MLPAFPRVGETLFLGVIKITRRGEDYCSVLLYPEPLITIANIEDWGSDGAPFLPVSFSCQELRNGRKYFDSDSETFYFFVSDHRDDVVEWLGGFQQAETTDVSEDFILRKNHLWQAGYLLAVFINNYRYVPCLAVGVRDGWLNREWNNLPPPIPLRLSLMRKGSLRRQTFSVSGPLLASLKLLDLVLG